MGVEPLQDIQPQPARGRNFRFGRGKPQLRRDHEALPLGDFQQGASFHGTVAERAVAAVEQVTGLGAVAFGIQRPAEEVVGFQGAVRIVAPELQVFRRDSGQHRMLRHAHMELLQRNFGDSGVGEQTLPLLHHQYPAAAVGEGGDLALEVRILRHAEGFQDQDFIVFERVQVGDDCGGYPHIGQGGAGDAGAEDPDRMLQAGRLFRRGDPPGRRPGIEQLARRGGECRPVKGVLRFGGQHGFEDLPAAFAGLQRNRARKRFRPRNFAGQRPGHRIWQVVDQSQSPPDPGSRIITGAAIGVDQRKRPESVFLDIEELARVKARNAFGLPEFQLTAVGGQKTRFGAGRVPVRPVDFLGRVVAVIFQTDQIPGVETDRAQGASVFHDPGRVQS